MGGVPHLDSSFFEAQDETQHGQSPARFVRTSSKAGSDLGRIMQRGGVLLESVCSNLRRASQVQFEEPFIGVLGRCSNFRCACGQRLFY